jgi:succinate dehydrogenase / fumarate reductase, membrane anchor subunit
MAGYRTPLARAQGLGSAKHGVGHWVAERVTAAALVPLGLWAVWALLSLAGADYEAARAFVRQPLNAVLLVLLTGVGFWHMHAGLRVVVEDYLRKTLTRSLVLLANLFVCWLASGLAVFSLLKVALGGAA